MVIRPSHFLKYRATFASNASKSAGLFFFIWRSDGLAAMALLNFPGSWHDGAIAWCGFYQAVKALDALGFKLVGDSAFRANLQALLVCDKDTTVLPPRGPLLTAHMEQQAAIKSVRQAAEWGMGTYQATWKRLKVPLPYNPRERRQLLDLTVRLLNFRTVHVGLAQIKTVFGTLQRMEQFGGAENVYGRSPA